MHKKALIAFLFTIVLCVGAQDHVFINGETPTDAVNPLGEIRIEGFVPNFLKISLDFASDSHALLRGYYPSEASANGKPSEITQLPQTGKEFPIHPGKIIDLGMAVLVSNVVGPYTISVFSANNGTLTSASAEVSAHIPYLLRLGEYSAHSQNGVFTFSSSGKSQKGGTRLAVQLVFDELPLPLPHSAYIDELSFVVAAN